MVNEIQLGGKKIGSAHPCFVIAEAGVNHNGSVEIARQLIDSAVAAGADAVKFQTFTASKVVAGHAPKADYQKRNGVAEESQLDMLRRLELPHQAFRELYEYCRAKGILFLSTPFDDESADFLDRLGVSAFKVPSGEITNLPFLRFLAQKNRPMILSTGMACLGEVETAVRAVEQLGNSELVLLHCVSSYPAPPEHANLRALETMKEAFGKPVGYSDHTTWHEVAWAAVALGACVIEKHFTLDRTLPGPDHQSSLQPQELVTLIRGIRIVESALGDGRKLPTASELEIARVARKSLVAARDIPAGCVLTEDMIAIKRPGTGLPPEMRERLVGRTVAQSVPEGALLTFSMVA